MNNVKIEKINGFSEEELKDWGKNDLKIDMCETVYIKSNGEAFIKELEELE